MLGLSEDATEEQISAKVAELNSAKTKAEGERDNFKRSFDKTSSELSTLKKEKMTEEEKKQAELDDIKAQLAEAQKQNKLTETEKQYMSVGMDAESAKQMAQAVLDGDLSAQGKIMKSYTDGLVAKAKADALKQQPDPNAGNGNGTDKTKYTPENFKKGLISMEELNDLKAKDPETYNKVIGIK